MDTNKISDAGLRQTPEAAAEAVGAADEMARREFECLYHRDRQEASQGMSRGRSGLTPERSGFSEPPARAGEYGHPPLKGPRDVSVSARDREEDALPNGEENREEAALPPDAEENRDASLFFLMRSLSAEHLGATAQAAPADTLAAPRVTEMVEHLVEQILVSRPDQVGEQEVRLMVRNSVLPDTEVRLSRGMDGLLSVTLTTGRSDALQTLVAAQAELKQALGAREDREVRLIVVDTRDAGAEEGQSDRRSRGYASYAPDDGTR